MQSAQAIRSALDALIELVTNSDDAYSLAGDDKGKIVITVTREKRERSGVIVVKDRAGGMTLDEMKQKILKYGAFSAGERTRGFMGRGAKDIVALGHASFESMKNDQVYRVELDSNFRFSLKKPVKACDEDYAKHGLRPGKGGMEVTLEVSKRYKVPQHETLVRDLQRHYALRDIFQRREVRLADGHTKEQATLRYTAPDGILFCDETLPFDAPYEGASARLQLFKAPNELPSELQEGVIVTDGHAIHQVTRFAPDLEEDAIARRFFGRLECSYVRQLQLEFEERRKKGEEPSADNPVDILDPNRRRGLDRGAHPFVMRLFDWAEKRLRAAVDEVREEEGKKETPVANEETKKRLKALSKAVAEHLAGRIAEETLSPRTQDQEAVFQQEGVFLNPQFNRIAVGETRRLGYTVLNFGVGEDPDHVTVTIEGEGVAVDNKEPPLRPQRRNPDRLSAYFEISGTGPTGNVVLTVTHQNELIRPVSRALEVVEPESPYADLPYGLFFEKQNYTVHSNGLRTLSFVAKGRRFRGVGWDAPGLIHSSRPEAATILRGNALSVEQVEKDVWHGYPQVRGQGVGKSSVVSLSIPTKDGVETANTHVKVVEKEEPPGVSVDIQIVPDPAGQWRAMWDRNNPNLLKVYAEHSTLARYLGPREHQYPGQNQPHFRILLAEIVAGKVVERILQARVEANPRLFADSQSFFFIYSEEMTSFLPIAHKIMLSDHDVARLRQE
jgi:hypothetical protein